MSLHETYDRNNILARIVRGELPSTRVFEDAETLVIMDIFPQSPGHMLAMHKQAEAINLLDIETAPFATLTATVQRAARAAAKALKPAGIRIAQFNGAPAGQTIFHLHFHIIPAYEDAPLRPHAAQKADPAELEALAAKLRAAFQAG
jgi:histidine triad (HIT) family protein